MISFIKDVTKQTNNSLIEFESSSNRQKKLNIKNNETTTFNLIDTKLDNTNNNNKLKYETVKLHFLAEKPHTDYLLNRTNNNNNNSNSNTNDKSSSNNNNNEFNDTILSQIEDLDKMTAPTHNHAPPPTISAVSNKFENSNESSKYLFRYRYDFCYFREL
jgi:hypothetical protein